MTPLFFGAGSRRLFGMYEPGRAVGRAPRAALVCYPWGQEYIRAHRSIRRLSNLLAASGRDTLRFDYFGTGDSAGEMVDADLTGWQKDIETAIDEVKDTSGASRVALIGLRLGGSLAACVAARRQRDVEALVLWDPVISGRRYLQELHALEASITSAAPTQRPSETGGGHEILGFPVTSAMTAELESFNLLSVTAQLPVRKLTIVTEPSPAYDDWMTAVDWPPDQPPTIEQMPCPPAWREDRSLGAGAIPVNVLQRVIQWLA